MLVMSRQWMTSLISKPLHLVSDTAPNTCSFQAFPPMPTIQGSAPEASESPQSTLGFLKSVKRRMWASSPSSEGLASFCSLRNESPQIRENTLCNRSLGWREEPPGCRPEFLLQTQVQGGNANHGVPPQFSCNSIISYFHSLPSPYSCI